MTRLLLLLAILLAPAATSHDAWTHCGQPDMLVDADGDGFAEAYIAFDVSGWAYLYQETNGILHLQRGDGGDTCDEGVPADSGHLLF